MASSKGGFSEPNQPKLANKPHYHGHRERLRQKFTDNGAQSLADYELLELLLFRIYPRKDTKPLAKALLSEFGSFGEVLASSTNRLMEVKGIGIAAASELKLIHAAARLSAATNIKSKSVLSSWSQLLEYCQTAMAYEDVEQFRILFLDKKNHLIKDEIQQTGTVDHTPVYPREVAKRALELSATAIILVHNHPSGDPTPSRADIEMTKRIVDTLKPLEVIVHDHIIIGRQGHASLKGLKLF